MLPLLNKYRPGKIKKSLSNLNADAKPWKPSVTNSPSNRSTSSTSTSAMSTSNGRIDCELPPPAERTFPKFNQLNNELRRHIFSFLADAPLEEGTGRMAGSSLTSTLPFVNKEFRKLSLRDEYWEPALRRRINDKSSGMIWKDGLRRFLPLDYEAPPETERSRTAAEVAAARQVEISAAVATTTTPEIPPIIQTVKSHLQAQQRDISHRELYKKVATTHIQFDAPIFIMPYPCQLGEMYGLHLFEPRYRVLVHDLLQHSTANPPQAATGGRIVPATENGIITPPLFIHAHRRSRLAPGETAMLVQLVRCRVYEHGNADVQLLPVSLVRLENIRVRPNVGHLFYAKASRMSGVGN